MTPPPPARALSTGAVLQAIASDGPISRASVARRTGLSKQTVSEVVAGLEAEGWVRVVGQSVGQIGRRAVVYDLRAEAATIASVDLGGTKLRVALCDLKGAILVDRTEPTHPDGGDGVVAQIARLVGAVQAEAGAPAGALRMAVIGVPGVPDRQSGVIRQAPNIAGLDRLDLAGALRARLGVETLVENDVNLAALGEHWIGHAAETDTLALLSVGTGIGAGLVVEGRLLRGGHGGAGEVAFLPFGADPFDAESRRQGALERAVGTGAIIARYAQLSGRRVGVPEIFDALAAGDPHAAETLDGVARQIARAIAALVALVDPEVVVVGGSIGRRPELLDRIRQAVPLCCPRPVRIDRSRLGGRAALAGGAAIALSQVHLALFAEGQRPEGRAVSPPSPERFAGSARGAAAE